MSTYANKTKVTPEKSRAEIERTLRRYGASGFRHAYMARYRPLPHGKCRCC